MAQNRIKCSDLREGMRYTAPVFFDDGKNMFLAESKPVKQYHLKALERWNIPFLLTYGHLIDEKKEDSKPKPVAITAMMQVSESSDVVEEFEDLELLEEVDDLEPLD